MKRSFLEYNGKLYASDSGYGSLFYNLADQEVPYTQVHVVEETLYVLSFINRENVNDPIFFSKKSALISLDNTPSLGGWAVYEYKKAEDYHIGRIIKLKLWDKDYELD